MRKLPIDLWEAQRDECAAEVARLVLKEAAETLRCMVRLAPNVSPTSKRGNWR